MQCQIKWHLTHCLKQLTFGDKDLVFLKYVEVFEVSSYTFKKVSKYRYTGIQYKYSYSENIFKYLQLQIENFSWIYFEVIH